MSIKPEEDPLLEKLVSALASTDYPGVVTLLRELYELLDDIILEVKLRDLTDEQRQGISVGGLMSIAWGVTYADSLYNMACAFWPMPERDQETIQIFRDALSDGSKDARLGLAESLLFLGERAEAEGSLRQILESRNTGWERAAGLLGRTYIEIDGRSDDEVIQLLRHGVTVSDDFAVPLAKVETLRGRFDVALRILNEQSEKRNDAAPIQLGLLYERHLNDPGAAEVAYRRGMELGDAFSAYNLATLLVDQDRDEEAHELMEYAKAHGDDWATKWLADDAGEIA